MEGMVTRKEAAAILGISLPTLKKRTDEGLYNTIKKGRSLMYFKSDLLKKEEEKEVSMLPVPTMKDLVKESFPTELNRMQEKRKDFAILLNNEPPTDWLKQHPIAKKKDGKGVEVPTNYLPIERLEYLLTRIFARWWVEIKFPPALIGNSVCVTVRLWVVNPLTGENEFQDGVGAVPIQTNAGSGAADMAAMKSNGVMLAAPMAETYAIKDAGEKFGKLFGKDLGRTETIDYSDIKKPRGEKSKDELREVELQRLKELIDVAETEEHLQNIADDIFGSGSEELEELFEDKRVKICGDE